MSVNKIREFIFANYYKRIGFSKENSYYSMKPLKRKDLLLLANKLREKIPDPRNDKQHFESILRRKNMKSVKQSEIIAYLPETFDTLDIKAVTTEHPKTSHKLSNTIRQAEKVGSNSSLYSDTKKKKKM